MDPLRPCLRLRLRGAFHSPRYTVPVPPAYSPRLSPALAALCPPVWTSVILAPSDFGLALAAFGLLVLWKLPPWLVVVLTAAAAALVAGVG